MNIFMYISCLLDQLFLEDKLLEVKFLCQRTLLYSFFKQHIYGNIIDFKNNISILWEKIKLYLINTFNKECQNKSKIYKTYAIFKNYMPERLEL